MADHRDLLRAELVRAAHRQAAPATTGRFSVRRAVPLLVAAAALVIVVAAGSLIRSDPVGAETFRITEQADGTVVVEVIGAIRDPEIAADELEAAGFSVTLEGVPTAPSLVGQLVSVYTEPADGTADAAVATESDGPRVIELRGEPDSLGTVVIMYGRPANEGELYVANDTVPGCAELSGQRITDDLIRAIIDEHGPHVRWQQLGPPVREVQAEQIDDDAVILTILGLSSDSALVIVGDSVEDEPGVSC